MALRLTPDMLAGAYEFLRTTGLSIGGNFLIVFLPSIFLLAIGLTLIGQRASMWYLD